MRDRVREPTIINGAQNWHSRHPRACTWDDRIALISVTWECFVLLNALESKIVPVSRYVALWKETVKVDCRDRQRISRHSFPEGNDGHYRYANANFYYEKRHLIPASKLLVERDKDPKRVPPITLNAIAKNRPGNLILDLDQKPAKARCYCWIISSVATVQRRIYRRDVFFIVNNEIIKIMLSNQISNSQSINDCNDRSNASILDLYYVILFLFKIQEPLSRTNIVWHDKNEILKSSSSLLFAIFAMRCASSKREYSCYLSR